MTNNKQALRGLSRAFFDSDLVATRLMLFVGELCWAVMLWWPGDTFSRPTYETMQRIAPELVWAVAFSITAALQIYLVAFEKHNHPNAVWFYWWNALIWSAAVASMLYSVYPPPAAIGAEIASAFAAIWIAIRPAILTSINRKVQRHFEGVCNAK